MAALHQRGTDLRVAENYQFSRCQGFACFFCTSGMIDAGEYRHAFAGQNLFQTIGGLGNRVCTFYADHAFRRQNRRYKQACQNEGQNGVAHACILLELRPHSLPIPGKIPIRYEKNGATGKYYSKLMVPPKENTVI